MCHFDIIDAARLSLFESIKGKSRFIGSRAWGVSSPDSDYDYLIDFNVLNEILESTEKDHPEAWKTKNVYQESHGDSCDIDKLREFYSIIIMIEGKRINVISPKGKINYRAWKQASRIFTKFIGEEFIKDKYSRVKMFECLKDIFRSKYMKAQRIKPKPKEAIYPAF